MAARVTPTSSRKPRLRPPGRGSVAHVRTVRLAEAALVGDQRAVAIGQERQHPVYENQESGQPVEEQHRRPAGSPDSA